MELIIKSWTSLALRKRKSFTIVIKKIYMKKKNEKKETKKITRYSSLIIYSHMISKFVFSFFLSLVRNKEY